MILTESVFNTVALYMILKKLMTPFAGWDACKLGIIDAKGKKLREPVSSKERDAWDLLTKFVWNFKKIISKFIGPSDFAASFSAAYLLKDSISLFYVEKNMQKINETILNDFTAARQLVIFNLIAALPKLQEKVTEDNFEILFLMYNDKVSRLLEDKNIVRETLLG
jgi:hypothetical protein